MFSKWLDYSYRPHACLTACDALVEGTGEKLARLIASHLSSKSQSVRVRKLPVKNAWWVSLIGSDEASSFDVAIRKSKYKNDQWVLMVAPAQIPRARDLLRRFRAVKYSEPLAALCRSIHALLANSSDIGELYWYLEGSGKQSTAVNSPDDLPWENG